MYNVCMKTTFCRWNAGRVAVAGLPVGGSPWKGCKRDERERET